MMRARRATLAIVTVHALGCGIVATNSGIQDAGLDESYDARWGIHDAAFDGGAGADPLVIFGHDLVLWLDASYGSATEREVDVVAGERVTAWRDRSEYHNDFAVRYVGVGGRIDVMPSVLGPAVMCMSGSSSNNGAFIRPDLSSMSGSYVIVVIAAYTNTPSDGYDGRAILFRKSLPGGSGQWLVGNSATTTNVWGGEQSPATSLGLWSAFGGWNDGAFHAFVLMKDGNTGLLTLRTGGMVSSKVVVGGGGTGGAVTIGGAPAGRWFTEIEGPVKGCIGEVIVVDPSRKAGQAPATDEEMARLGAYIQEKYGLPF